MNSATANYSPTAANFWQLSRTGSLSDIAKTTSATSSAEQYKHTGNAIEAPVVALPAMQYHCQHSNSNTSMSKKNNITTSNFNIPKKQENCMTWSQYHSINNWRNSRKINNTSFDTWVAIQLHINSNSLITLFNRYKRKDDFGKIALF